MKLKPANLLKISVSLVMLVIVVSNVGAENLLDTLRGVDLRWFALAVVIHLIGIGIRAYRWWLLIAWLGAPVPFGRLLYLYFVGNFFGTFLPTGIGGDVVKIIELAPDQGGANAFSAVFADRLTGVLGSSLIALVIALFDPIGVPPDVLATVVIASAGILAGALAMTQARRLERFERWKRFLQQPFWGKLHKVYVALTSYSFGAIARSTLVSLPFTATLIATQYVLSIALGVSVEARYFILFTPLIALTQVLPISFNGLGVREGAFGVLFGSVGVAGSDAVAISLLYYITRVLTGLFGGILYVIGNLYHPSSHRRTNP